MDISFDTWAKFAKSGKIEDYLHYKAVTSAETAAEFSEKKARKKVKKAKEQNHAP